MKLLLIAIFLCCCCNMYGQSSDSLESKLLSEVVTVGVHMEGDTLQSFYRSNTSTTTEGVLSRMKGMSLIRRGAYGQEPVMRGLSNGQLNITLDGMKMFGACTDRMDPVTIYVEPVNLSSINAIAGTSGSKYGSTVGGSLNMKMAQPMIAPYGLSGRAGVDVQSSARSVNYFSSINVGKNTSAYRASVAYRNADNYRAGGGEEVLFSQYRKVNVSASGKWALGSVDTLLVEGLFDQGRDIGFPALPMDVGKASAGILSITHHRVAPWIFFHNFRIKAYYNEITHSMDDTHRPDVVMHMDMPGASKTGGVFLEGDVHLFHEHKTFVKLEYFGNRLVGEMTMYPEEGLPMYMQTMPASIRHNTGLYVEQHLRFDWKNKILISFRGDVVHDQLDEGIGKQQWDVFHSDLEQSSARFIKTASLSYTRSLSDRYKLTVQGGYGERMPTMNERYGFYLFNRFDGHDYIGNPNLMTETSLNTDFRLSYFGSAIEWEIEPFYQRLDNYITARVLEDVNTMTIGAYGVKQQVNLPWADLAGFDMMILFSPFPFVQWINTVKYTYGVNSQAEALPLIPPLKLVSSLRYEIGKVFLQGEVEAATSQNRVSESFNERTTKGYAIVNIRGEWKVNGQWKVNAGIENIFDSYYSEHLDWGGVPRPGRNIYLNVNFSF